MITIEARSHLRKKIAVRQQVTRHLLRHEPVKRHVVVQRLDQPIAPHPHVTQAIVLVAVRVCITRGLHPAQCHVLAIARRRQQAVHRLLVCPRRGVLQKSIQLRDRRRQPRQVKRHPPQERRLVRRRRRLQAFSLQPRQHKGINRIASPLAILHLWQRRLLRRHKRPMPIILRPLRARLQPLHQLRAILITEIPIRIRRRHLQIRIRARQPLEHFPVRQYPRLQRSHPVIQPQFPLPRLPVRPVAVVARIRQHWSDVSCKVQWSRRKTSQFSQQNHSNDAPIPHEFRTATLYQIQVQLKFG